MPDIIRTTQEALSILSCIRNIYAHRKSKSVEKCWICEVEI